MKKLIESIADYVRETDRILFILCIFTASYGAVIVLSASFYSNNGWRRFAVQISGMLIGLVLAVIITLFDYNTLSRYWHLAAVVAVGLVLLTFFIGYAPHGTDDKAWLRLPGGQSFQPSELLKIAFILTFSHHISTLDEKIISKPKNVLALCLHGALPVGLIHLQGDDGSALVIALIFLAMLFASGVNLRYFVIALGALVPALPVAWFFVFNQAQKKRILALLYPDNVAYVDTVYQQIRGRTAIGSGGLTGYGLFKGPYVQSGKIPLGYNDFIFASVGEELGFLGCLAVLILLLAICLRVLVIGRRSRDVTGRIICTGVFAMLAAQTIINIGMCVFLLPVIGVTLPFFSAGGTSMVTLLMGIGLAACVYKNRNRRVITLSD